MAHFIGKDKPWSQGREANQGSTPYDEMVGRWWAVYDRHYRESSAESGQVAPIIQYHTKGEFQPVVPIVAIIPPNQSTETDRELFHPTVEQPLHETAEIPKEVEETYVPPVDTNLEKGHYSAWDASRAPPPVDSRPEAGNFPATHYGMSSDPTPFKAPERYPDPPKDMYYEVPKTPTYQKPAPIFPWEKNASKPTRVFAEDNADVYEVPSASETGPDLVEEDKNTTTFTRGNAWDDIPEIERYIGNLQKNRKGNIQVLQGYGSGIEQASSPGARGHSMKLTDFPTELERPSLPVTPAPIRRPSFWGDERDDEGELPAAEGVPSQEDWDPVVQLEQLARRQSDVLASKLGKDGGLQREIPMRPLPYGSEGVISPTYVAQAPISSSGTASSVPRTTIEEPSYHGPSAAWEKNETFPSQETPMPPSEEEKDVLET